jgi:hypothetical protein
MKASQKGGQKWNESFLRAKSPLTILFLFGGQKGGQDLKRRTSGKPNFRFKIVI